MLSTDALQMFVKEAKNLQKIAEKRLKKAEADLAGKDAALSQAGPSGRAQVRVGLPVGKLVERAAYVSHGWVRVAPSWLRESLAGSPEVLFGLLRYVRLDLQCHHAVLNTLSTGGACGLPAASCC